jgi:hypothetical protein
MNIFRTAVPSQEGTKTRSKGKVSLLKTLCGAVIVAVVSSGFPLAPAQASGTYDGTDGTVLCSTSGHFTILDNVVTGHTECVGAVVIPAGVTSIAGMVFFAASGLTSAMVPASVTSIGDMAFSYTNALTSITVASLNPNYSSLDGVLFDKNQTLLIAYANKVSANYSIPSGVTTIGSSAFRLSTLTSVTIPSSVTSIGEAAFGGASSLASVVFSGTSTLATIDGYAFQSAQSLTSITIPASVTTIGDSAFGSAMSLASVVFSGTSTLATIGADAFSNTSLTSFTIPASVTTIGANAFLSYSLVSISVEEANQNYSSLDGVLFNKPKTTLIIYPASKLATTYSIPTSVTRIEASAFFGADFTSVTIPSSVTTIGTKAFFQTDLLTSITVEEANLDYSSLDGVLFDKEKISLISYPIGKTGTTYSIPSSVESIETFAFNDGSSLNSVTIPSATTSIATYAFWHAPHLNVYFLGNAPTVGNDAFEGVTGKAYIKTGATGFAEVGSTWHRLTVAVLDDGVRSCTTGTYDVHDFVATNGSSCAGAVAIADGVQAIQTETFMGNQSLTSVTIPASVVSIGSNSFYFIPTLTSFTVDSASPNFSSEDGVLFNKSKSSLLLFPAARGNAPYTVPGSVVTIAARAFLSDRSLTSITIPENVESIGDYAFAGAEKLTSVTFSGTSKLASIGKNAFQQSNLGAINIPAGVTIIGEVAFAQTPLTSVTFDVNSSITTIGSSTFEGAQSLTSITIPASVTSIKSYAFYGASKLTNVVFLGNAPTPVGVEAFTEVAAGAKATISASATGFPAVGSAWYGLTVATASPPAVTPPAETPPAVIPPAAAIVTTTPVLSAVGTSVAIAREPSAAVATAVAIGVSKTKVMVALKVPKASKPANQVTKYVIQLKSAKGVIITKTISARAGGTVKPTLTGKKKTSYSMTVTAVTKSGKKTTWKGPQVKIS